MTTTLPKEIEQQIITRLEDGNDRDDILLDLCESQGLDWKEAESILDSIQAENADDIALTQSPILVLIALAIFIGGLALLAIAAYDIATVYSAYASTKSPASTGFLFYLFAYGGFFWELALLGAGMIAGSLRGMSDVWSAIFSKLGLFQGIE